MERRHLDVGATRLIPGASPLPAHTGDQPVESVPIEMDRKELPTQIADVPEIFAARPGQVNCSPRAKQRRIAAWPIQIEHRFRSEAESALRRVAAKACLPEGRGTARCVPAAHVLSLDDHHFRIAGKSRAEARSGNSAADNQDVNFLHREAGYGLERLAV